VNLLPWRCLGHLHHEQKCYAYKHYCRKAYQ
jgi:hypothetical protein